MQHDIIIVREGEGYRLLHGHLRLSNMLHRANPVCIEIKGEGSVKVMKTGAGYLAGKDVPRLPLHQT
jgi:hypothetical protein